MLLKKYTVPMALGDVVYFSISGSKRTIPSLRLSKLDMKDGVIAWEMRSSAGHILVGNATAEIENVPLGAGKELWIKPAIPIKLHVRNGTSAIDMMFNLPGSVFIKVVRSSTTPA